MLFIALTLCLLDFRMKYSIKRAFMDAAFFAVAWRRQALL